MSARLIIGAVFVNEKHALTARRLLKLSGCHALYVVALLVAVAQVLNLLVAPWPNEQGQQSDAQEDGPGKTKQRLHEKHQALSTGKPNHHFTVCIHARQC